MWRLAVLIYSGMEILLLLQNLSVAQRCDLMTKLKVGGICIPIGYLCYKVK